MEENDKIVFPCAEPECSLFFTIGATHSHLPQIQIQKQTFQKNKIEIIRDELAEELCRTYKKPLLNHPKQEKPIEFWLRKSFLNLSHEIFINRQSAALHCFNIANQIIDLFNTCLENNITCTCNVVSFRQYIIKQVTSTNSLLVLQKHRLSLKETYNRHVQQHKESIPILEAVKNILEDSFVAEGYSPPSYIDDIIEEMVIQDGNVLPAKIIELFSLKDKRKFNLTIDFVMQITGLSSKTHRIIVKCALIRMAFNKCWQSISCILNIPDKKSFVNNYKRIRTFTPKNIGLSKNLFTNDQYNTPISQLEEIESIKMVSDELSKVQFLNNPLDMTFKINESINKINEYAIKNEKVKKMEMLSFDDCFSIFFAAFASQQLCGIEAIRNFIDAFDVDLPSHLKFAQNLLSAIVKTVDSFDFKAADL